MILILAVWIASQKDSIDPGLIAWRTPDNAERSCSSCHSPDGIELAAYGFAKDDLVRRAARHLTEERQTQVVKWILQNRGKIHGEAVNPMMGRPLQPGGRVLPGFTPKDRDLAFQTSLGSAAPKLEGPRIRSLKAAKEIRDEVLDLDLKSLSVGIEMNRLSEDGFHGKDHATLAHWIPDVPVLSVVLGDGWWWLLAKVFFFASCFIWFRASFPRYRYDQIMRLGWKVFIPITIAWIVVTALLVYFGIVQAGQ